MPSIHNGIIFSLPFPTCISIWTLATAGYWHHTAMSPHVGGLLTIAIRSVTCCDIVGSKGIWTVEKPANSSAQRCSPWTN